jgi:hypothetical protein
MKTTTSILLMASLLVFASCGSTGSDSKKEKSSAPGEKVKPPAMDLHAAALMGNLDVIKQHIEAGSDLDEAEPSVGSSPLITASVFGKTEAAIALIEGGADVNFQNMEKSTALHTASFLCRTEIVEALLENGADKYLRNIYGSTPLESVSGPFGDVKEIYEQFQKDLGPLGLKLDYEYLESTRPVIAEMLQDKEEQ